MAGEKHQGKGRRGRKQQKDEETEPTTASAIRIVEDEVQEDTELLNLPGPSASLSSVEYSSLLKPLKDITKSFSIDIEATLSQLLKDFTKAQFGSSSNARSTFATAGLILASCSDKYGKKVDHLLNMVRQLHKDVWDVSVKRTQVVEKDSEKDDDDKSESGDIDDCSDDDEEPEVSGGKQKRGKGLKGKDKFLTTAFKEAVFLTSKPNFYDDFLPLPFSESSTSVDMKESSLDMSYLDKPKLIARESEVHLDIGRSRPSNYNVIDWRQESVGKIFDFFSQTSRIESGALVLFQSALPSRDKPDMMIFDNATKQAGVLPELDVDRPIRLQSPNSYHSFVDDASLNYAPSSLGNTLGSSSQTGNLSRRASESALSLDIPECLNFPVENETTKDAVTLQLTPTDSCLQDFLSQTSETATLENSDGENDRNFDCCGEKQCASVEVSNPVNSSQNADNEKCCDLKETERVEELQPFPPTTELSTPIDEIKTIAIENSSEANVEETSDCLLLKNVPSPGSSTETISLPPETDLVSPENVGAKSDSGMGTDSSGPSSVENRAIISFKPNCLILSSFAEDLKTVDKSLVSKQGADEYFVMTAEDLCKSDEVLTFKSKMQSRIYDEHDGDNDDDLTLAQLAKLTPKCRKRNLDTPDGPNPKKLGRFDLDDDTSSLSSENCDKKFAIGSGLFFSDSISTNNNQLSTPQLPFECTSSHLSEKEYHSDHCFSVVSYGKFPANHEDDCLPFKSKDTAEKVTTPSPDSNPVSPFSYRPFSPGFVAAPHVLDSPANSGFSSPDSEPVVEEVGSDQIESDHGHDHDLDLNIDPSCKELDDSFDECDERKKSYASVKRWESKIGPVLKRQEKLPKFDVAKTSRDLVRNLKTVPEKPCNFTDIFNESTELYEIPRAFVSCLGLASSMNIEIFPQSSPIDVRRLHEDFKLELKKNEENFADKDLLKLSEVEQQTASSSKAENATVSKEVVQNGQKSSDMAPTSKRGKISKNEKRSKKRTKNKTLPSSDEEISSDSDSDFEI